MLNDLSQRTHELKFSIDDFKAKDYKAACRALSDYYDTKIIEIRSDLYDAFLSTMLKLLEKPKAYLKTTCIKQNLNRSITVSKASFKENNSMELNHHGRLNESFTNFRCNREVVESLPIVHSTLFK